MDDGVLDEIIKKITGLSTKGGAIVAKQLVGNRVFRPLLVSAVAEYVRSKELSALSTDIRENGLGKSKTYGQAYKTKVFSVLEVRRRVLDSAPVLTQLLTDVTRSNRYIKDTNRVARRKQKADDDETGDDDDNDDGGNENDEREEEDSKKTDELMTTATLTEVVQLVRDYLALGCRESDLSHKEIKLRCPGFTRLLSHFQHLAVSIAAHRSELQAEIDRGGVAAKIAGSFLLDGICDLCVQPFLEIVVHGRAQTLFAEFPRIVALMAHYGRNYVVRSHSTTLSVLHHLHAPLAADGTFSQTTSRVLRRQDA
jgi:hypothetical protein